MRLESVQIGVPDVGAAAVSYERLLDAPPESLPGGAVRFSLARGAIVLARGDGGLRSMRFAVDAIPAGLSPGVFNGIEVAIEPQAAPEPPSPSAGNVEAIDHVVVQSDDADRAIALWRDRMGLRLALDRVFPDRGLRLLFFRSGGITLEYASPHPPAERGGLDRFYGLSYRVRDLAGQRDRLLAAGVDVSPLRPGIRPGTSVVTVRSGTEGVPTLLLQLDAGAT